MFLGCLRAGSWPVAVENGLHVDARLCVWRDAVVASHGAGPGIVGGQGEHGPELVGEAAQVGDAGVDILSGVEGIGDAEVALRTRHQLHQALGPGGRLRGCAVPGLDGDDGMHQVGVDAVPLGGRVDDVGERPLGGLGRVREEAGSDGEQQEHEATEGAPGRRHGERATYHIKGRTPHSALRPAAKLTTLFVRSASTAKGERVHGQGGVGPRGNVDRERRSAAVSRGEGAPPRPHGPLACISARIWSVPLSLVAFPPCHHVATTAV